MNCIRLHFALIVVTTLMRLLFAYSHTMMPKKALPSYSANTRKHSSGGILRSSKSKQKVAWDNVSTSSKTITQSRERLHTSESDTSLSSCVTNNDTKDDNKRTQKIRKSFRNMIQYGKKSSSSSKSSDALIENRINHYNGLN